MIVLLQCLLGCGADFTLKREDLSCSLEGDLGQLSSFGGFVFRQIKDFRNSDALNSKELFMLQWLSLDCFAVTLSYFVGWFRVYRIQLKLGTPTFQ